MPVWLWVNDPTPTTWGPATISAGGVTLTARVQSVTWDMGDGTTLTCGKGTEWKRGMGGNPSPTCGHTYDKQGQLHDPGAVALAGDVVGLRAVGNDSGHVEHVEATRCGGDPGDRDGRIAAGRSGMRAEPQTKKTAGTGLGAVRRGPPGGGGTHQAAAQPPADRVRPAGPGRGWGVRLVHVGDHVHGLRGGGRKDGRAARPADHRRGPDHRARDARSVAADGARRQTSGRWSASAPRPISPPAR